MAKKAKKKAAAIVRSRAKSAKQRIRNTITAVAARVKAKAAPEERAVKPIIAALEAAGLRFKGKTAAVHELIVYAAERAPTTSGQLYQKAVELKLIAPVAAGKDPAAHGGHHVFDALARLAAPMVSFLKRDENPEPPPAPPPTVPAVAK